MLRRRIALASWLCLCGVFVSGACAAAYVTAPVVRVETGMHSGAVRALDTDANNRYLVSGGADKTVRLWSQPQGQLLKVMRPPIGDNNEGRIDAVAMSPDGSRIAAGGDTCRSYEKSYCVFIFDTASGAIAKRITGFPNGITRLAWSPDGATLAVGLFGRGGLHLLRTADWSTLGVDGDYADWITSLHFDGRGRLASGSGDRNIRLYAYDDKGLRLDAKLATSRFELPGMPSWSYRYVGIPNAVRFSPDGSKLAVGQTAGANWVTVMAPDTLKTLYVASTIRMPNIGIENLAWSADGETLYAATITWAPRPMMLRKWSRGGRGDFVDLPAGQLTVAAAVALRNGGIAFATADPAIGIYDAGGTRSLLLTAQAADFYGRTEAFRVSRDGAYVEFAYDAGATLGFDLVQRKLVGGPGKGPATQEPVFNADGLLFYNGWKDTRRVLAIGNTLLKMGPFETSRSLAIAPDGGSVLVGTSAFLRHYARDGKPLWSVPTTFNAFAVNFSGDGRYALAAIGDGTIRWYARESGRHLLTLFVAPDRKRWVLVSPTGFYDTSVGAEDLIGWHINRGRDEAADFFPVSRLRAAFYKPEILADIIRKADDSEAFRRAAAALGVTGQAASAEAPAKPARPETPAAAPQPATPATPAAAPQTALPRPATAAASAAAKASAAAAEPAAVADAPTAPASATAPIGAAAGEGYAVVSSDDDALAPQQVADLLRVLPPVVTVLSPASGSSISGNSVTLRYTVKSDKDAPVTAVRTRVNGVGRAESGTRAAVAEVREVTLELPPEDSEILLFAENKHGVSTPASVRLTWAGARPAPASDGRPVLYVLAIGVSEYLEPENRLRFAAKDAADFSAVVQKQKGALYGDVVVNLLTDKKASRAEVLRGFEWLQQKVTPRDVGIVLIAGHGINDDKGNYYYLPYEGDAEQLEKTGVPFSAVKGRLANLRGKGLLFVDTCHSGNVMGKRSGMSYDATAILNELASPEYGLVVIASSTGKQFSLESTEWGNGAFTKALVEGLSGRADLKKRGRITHKMLDFYVSDRVEELTHGQQTPVNTSPLGVPDYTIATVGVPG